MINELTNLLPRAALAYRGYNITNLGRTPELMDVAAYRPVIKRRLEAVSEVASDQLGRPIDLVATVQSRTEPSLAEYDEAIALVYAASLAHVDLLRETHGLDPGAALMAFGYSLGEVTALAASGVLPERDAIRAPLAMAADCAGLAEGVTMGVVFSRRMALNEAEAHRLCAEITAQGAGIIAVAAVLSPNTVLVLGQGEALDRFRENMAALSPSRVYLRVNDSKWPPLHTPIVRLKNVPDRASVMMQTLDVSAATARPPVFSLVTGKMAESEPNIRELMRRWIDHPQRLWDAVCATLASNARTVVHIGPEPNLIPATFRRLSDNVAQQTSNGVSGLPFRALQQMAGRPWLASILPQRASLLRAPHIRHVILEDWLMENAP